jgi:hypothetical protein
MSKDYAQIANDVVTGVGLLRQGAPDTVFELPDRVPILPLLKNELNWVVGALEKCPCSLELSVAPPKLSSSRPAPF